MQAMILAAGMGKRLKELTNNNTKCMVEVNGETLIKRMLSQLDQLGLTKIIMVVGYKAEPLLQYISTLSINTKIEYVENEIFNKTNNIYSLFLARHYLLEEDTLLLESDLIFESSILKKIVDDPYPSLALVAKYESWMDGTVVTLDGNNITSFLDKKSFKFSETSDYYKTVNIYKFSKEFSASHYVPFLEAYSKALGDNEYYEQVLKVISLLDKPEIKAVKLENEDWYEIDDLQDLDIAESIFAQSQEKKLNKFQIRYGGYWRYPEMIDFCYLVNPFFPPRKLIDEMKANFTRLLSEYPSGLRVNNLLAGKYFGVDQSFICIGNGAAELIKSLMEHIKGKSGIIFPTFEEYPNRYKKEDIVEFIPDNESFSYSADDLIDYFDSKDIANLLLINPDNPSGNFIDSRGIHKLMEWSGSKKINLIVDESFLDFADSQEENSLLNTEILKKYPHTTVIKSISKSYGVPGVRLGVIASANTELISFIKADVSIWNINSFGEFFMQIIEKYRNDYQSGLQEFIEERKWYTRELKSIKSLNVYESQANYIMCEITEKLTSRRLTEILLTDFNIFIKDLSVKKGFNREYIRVAVRNRKDNQKLISALKELF